MSLCQEGPTNGYLAPASLHQNPTPGTRHQKPSTPDTRHLQDNSSAHQIPPPSPATDHTPNHTPSLLHQTESTRSSGLKSGAKISLINAFFGLVFFSENDHSGRKWQISHMLSNQLVFSDWDNRAIQHCFNCRIAVGWKWREQPGVSRTCVSKKTGKTGFKSRVWEHLGQEGEGGVGGEVWPGEAAGDVQRAAGGGEEVESENWEARQWMCTTGKAGQLTIHQNKMCGQWECKAGCDCKERARGGGGKVTSLACEAPPQWLVAHPRPKVDPDSAWPRGSMDLWRRSEFCFILRAFCLSKTHPEKQLSTIGQHKLEKSGRCQIDSSSDEVHPLSVQGGVDLQLCCPLQGRSWSCWTVFRCQNYFPHIKLISAIHQLMGRQSFSWKGLSEVFISEISILAQYRTKRLKVTVKLT